jgi:hypothetical protein
MYNQLEKYIWAFLRRFYSVKKFRFFLFLNTNLKEVDRRNKKKEFLNFVKIKKVMQNKIFCRRFFIDVFFSKVQFFLNFKPYSNRPIFEKDLCQTSDGFVGTILWCIQP